MYHRFIANNRFDKSVKTAMVASAEKLGAPAPKQNGSSSTKITKTVAPTHTTVKTSSVPTTHVTAKPVPTKPAFRRPFEPSQTDDAVAMADKARYEKAHQVNDNIPEATPWVKSRLFRF